MNPFTIQNHFGAPTFFKSGVPVFPLAFWQTEILDQDALAFSRAGIEIYSFFRSAQHYEHPYWTGENLYDFSFIDRTLKEFHAKLPRAYCIPRIFVSAPDWWLEKNPDELCGFAVEAPRTRYNTGRWQGTFHESFASEKWKLEMGDAFRQLIRHMKSADYADCIIGIHIANGITGEWHLWSPHLRPDTSICMAKRYGRPIPPPEKRDASYCRCLHEATVEAIGHFAGIVKEESDYLTAVFYGYTPREAAGELLWRPEGDHRAADLLYRLPDIDIVCAPHTYERRKLGEDGYPRNFPASAALHGKLFIDEGDDRSYLDGREGNGYAQAFTGAEHPADCEGSLQIIRREFGNMLTRNFGMWYMDLNGGNFHDDRIMAEIARLKRWGDYSMKLPRSGNAEVAVIASLDSEFHLPAGAQVNERCTALYGQQLGELCKTGAPFDFYVSSDLESAVMEHYKIIFCLSALSVSHIERQRLHELQRDSRTFLWFHDSGAVLDDKYSCDNSSDLTGFDMSGSAPSDPVKHEFPGWTSIDLGNPVVMSQKLRELFRSAHVHIYLDTDDVLSVSESALMLHASSPGEKRIRLPELRRVINLVTGEILENSRDFSLKMQFGETALFLLEATR